MSLQNIQNLSQPNVGQNAANFQGNLELKDLAGKTERANRASNTQSPYSIETLSDVSKFKPLASRSYNLGRKTGPIKALNKIKNDWNLSIENTASILGFESNQVNRVRSILTGLSTITTKDEKDRLGLIFGIHYGLRSVFKNLDNENHWLNSPKSLLNNLSPIDLLRDGSMIKLLTVKQLVDLLSGRK